MQHIYSLFIITLSLNIFGLSLYGQNQAAALTTENFVIKGATCHIGNGEVVEDCVLVSKDGKITEIGNLSALPVDAGLKTIEGNGKHIYPGFIVPNTNLGLVEIDAVRATEDFEESGSLNPSSRALIAYNTDSEVIPTIRNRGPLLAQITPRGGLLSGKSSVVRLDAWNWEDAVVKADEGQHLNWPRMMRYDWSSRSYKKSEGYEKQLNTLNDFFDDASAYCNGTSTTRNLHLEALCPVLNGEANLYVHVNRATEIQQALAFAKARNVKMVIIGGHDAWRMTEQLANQNIPVILHQTHSVPFREDEDVDQTFKNAKILHDAGVKFAFSMNGGWEQRNLAFQAGQAIGYGLPYEEAVKSLTLNTATIMGIDELYGSLEKGKSATLILVDGDVFDMRTNNIDHAWIDGMAVDLDDKQARLYRKFKTKYEKQ